MDGIGENRADLGGQRGDVHDLIAESAIGEVSYKELYEELVRSEERFRLLYENSPLGYQSLDSNGCMLEVNPAWLDLLGYDRDEVIGRYFGDFVVREELLAERFPKFKKSGEVRGVDFQIVCKDGRIIDVEIDGKVAYNADGSFRQTHCILHDVTERRKGEQDRENLLRVIKGKNDEMQSIVYVASHDLKSPLVNITGFGDEMGSHCEELLEMLGKVTVRDDDSERLGILLNDYIPESLGFIHSATKKMRELIDGLLQVSRVGTYEMVIRELDMNELIGGIVESVGFEAKKAGVEIIVEGLVNCIGDEAKTNQIFSNLIDNAIKYLDPKRKGVIRVSCRVEDGQSLYCVDDNGMGIDPKYQKRVFEIFHRLVPGDLAGGEGLGLTIVRRIVDRLGGRVWVESESGKGSKFFVSLPNK